IEPPEKAGDNITVNTGLLTPTKSQKSRSRGSTPTKKVASINDKLKDAGNIKAQKPAAKGSKAKAAAQPAKKKTVKYIKPASSAAKSKTTTQKGKSKGPQASQNSTITTNFTQTKTASVAAKSEAAKKAPQSPSKLRQVSNASDKEKERLHSVPPQDPRNNAAVNPDGPLTEMGAGDGMKRKSVPA
ncbi:hypothetical protein KC355_g19869, partial [Hortaea werneckii]